MNATGLLLHLRARPYTAQRGGEITWSLPLIERQGRVVKAEIVATCANDETRAWVDAHHADLVRGVSLSLALQNIRARDNELRGELHTSPEILPGRWTDRDSEASPTTTPPAAPAQPLEPVQ